MKKHFNRLLSLVIATVIILTFSAVPAFASEEPTEPTTWTPTSETADRTKRTIKVKNVISSATVRAYQIVKGKYKDGKLTGYELCDGLSSIPNINSFNFVSPTSDWITKIANYIQDATQNNTLTLDYVVMRDSYGDYVAEVEAGEYIILVSSNDRINNLFNPAIVSVNVTDANLLNVSTNGLEVDMQSQFSAGDTAYIKSSGASIYKRIIVNDNMSTRSTALFEDTINFRTVTRIPSYSKDYGTDENPLIYRVIDNLNPDGFTNSPFLGVNGLTIKIGTESRDSLGKEVFIGSEVPEVTGEGAEEVRNYTLKYFDEGGHEITNKTAENLTQAVKYQIEFTDAFIRANGMKHVEVTYSSTFTDVAKLALSDYRSDLVPNRTEATLRYSDDPAAPTSYYEQTGQTWTYTFGIDAVGDGIQTYELNKVTQAGETYTSVPNSNNETTKKSPYALAGATFTIYSDRAMTNVIAKAGTATTPPNGTSISDANGHIEFRGLAAGTYYIKETAAPSGYTLNANNYKVVISPTFLGSLSSYTITTYLMGETDTQIGSATYVYSSGTITPTVTPAEVVNTRLSTLPTTGGVGTIVISVVAGLGMAVFLTIFVISKKRKAKKIDTQTID